MQKLKDEGKNTEDIFLLEHFGLFLIKSFLVIPEPCCIPQRPQGLSLFPCSVPQDAARAAAAVQKQHPRKERKNGSFSHAELYVNNSAFHKNTTYEPFKMVSQK